MDRKERNINRLLKSMKAVFQENDSVKINPIRIESVQYIDENDAIQEYTLQPEDNYCIVNIQFRGKKIPYLFLDRNGFLYPVKFVTFYCEFCNHLERNRIDYFFNKKYPDNLICGECAHRKSIEERRNTLNIIEDLPDTEALSQIKEIKVDNKWITVNSKLEWKIIQGCGNGPGLKLLYNGSIVITEFKYVCKKCGKLKKTSVIAVKDIFYCQRCGIATNWYYDTNPEDNGEDISNLTIFAVKTKKDEIWHEVINEDIQIKTLELRKGQPNKYIIYKGLICDEVKYRCKNCGKELSSPAYLYLKNKNFHLCHSCAMRTEGNPEKQYNTAIKTVKSVYDKTSKSLPFEFFKMYHLSNKFLTNDERLFISLYTEEAIFHLERFGTLTKEVVNQELEEKRKLKEKLLEKRKQETLKESLIKTINERRKEIDSKKVEIKNMPRIIKFRAVTYIFSFNGTQLNTSLVKNKNLVIFESEILLEGYDYFVSIYRGNKKLIIIYNNLYYIVNKVICLCKDCEKSMSLRASDFLNKYLLDNKFIDIYCHACSLQHSENWKINGKRFPAPKFIVAVEDNQNQWHNVIFEDLETFATKTRKYLKYEGYFVKRIKVRCENCKKDIITEWYSLSNIKHFYCSDCSALNNVNNHVKEQSALFEYLINIHTCTLDEYNFFMKVINYIRINRNHLLLKQSSPQMKVAEYLYHLHLMVVEEFPFIDFRVLRKNKIRGMNIKGYNLFDAALIKEKIIIETLGDRWHEAFIKYLNAVNYDFYHVQDTLRIDNNLISVLDANKNEKSTYCKNEIQRDSKIRKFGWRIIYITESQVKSNEYKIIIQQKLTEYGVINGNFPTREFIRNNIHLMVDWKVVKDLVRKTS